MLLAKYCYYVSALTSVTARSTSRIASMSSAAAICVPLPHEVAYPAILCCTGQRWQRVDEAYRRFAPYRDSSLDRWHRKTMLMTGSAALRGNLKALNQSLSAQVPPCIFASLQYCRAYTPG